MNQGNAVGKHAAVEQPWSSSRPAGQGSMFHLPWPVPIVAVTWITIHRTRLPGYLREHCRAPGL